MTHASRYARAVRYAADAADPADHAAIHSAVTRTYLPTGMGGTGDFDHAGVAAYADYLAATGDPTAPVVRGHFDLQESRPGVPASVTAHDVRVPGHGAAGAAGYTVGREHWVTVHPAYADAADLRLHVTVRHLSVGPPDTHHVFHALLTPDQARPLVDRLEDVNRWEAADHLLRLTARHRGEGD